MNTKTSFLEHSYFAQILGPLFLLPGLLLANTYHPSLNYDLLGIGGLGLLLCATKQTRGCGYTLALLAISSIIKHLWITDHHLFQACLESSVAFSLIVTSLVFTETEGASVIIREQMDKKSQTIQFLEEELTGQRTKFTTEIDISGQKLVEMQKLVEETQDELSAVTVLNDVLRNRAKIAIEESQAAHSHHVSAESRSGLLLEEIDALQRELGRVSNDGALVQQNQDLFKELNAARIKSTQTHLINETLARMLATHAAKSASFSELEAEKTVLLQKMQSLEEALISQQNEHNQKIDELLQKTLLLEEQLLAQPTGLSQTIEELEERLRAQKKEAQQKIEALSEENIQLQKRLATDLLYTQENLSKRLAQGAETEALYRQLREQFAQKDRTLNETRQQLFYAETEVQRLERELHEKQLQENPFPLTLRKEIEAIEEENEWIQEENIHLTALITDLMANSGSSEKKK